MKRLIILVPLLWFASLLPIVACKTMVRGEKFADSHLASGEAGESQETSPEPGASTIPVLGILDYHPSGKTINNGGLCGVVMFESARTAAESAIGLEFHEVEVKENSGPVPNIYFRNANTGDWVRVGNGMRAKGSTLANCPIASDGNDWISNLNRIPNFVLSARMPGAAKPKIATSATKSPPKTPSNPQRWFDCDYRCYCDGGLNFPIPKRGISSHRGCWEESKTQCEGTHAFLQGRCVLEGTIYSRSP